MPRAPQLADKLQGEALYGVNPVLGALQALRRDCHTLYIQEGQLLLGMQLSWPMHGFVVLFAIWGFFCPDCARRDAHGCLTNFLPSQWQKIKWRLPQSDADLRTSTQHHCCCAFPQVPATTFAFTNDLYGQHQKGKPVTCYLHRAANDGKKKKEGIPQAITAMKAAGGSIEYVTKHDLNQLVDNRPHQVPHLSLMDLRMLE